MSLGTHTASQVQRFQIALHRFKICNHQSVTDSGNSFLNWDDLKSFLTLAHTGSILAAAIGLKVNHATASRRIDSFEVFNK
jgi:hypothetical protein